MKRSLRFLLSIISGVLLSLAWLGFPGWILFVAFLPLLLLEDYFQNNKKDFLSISFWGHAYLAFIVWNLLTTWWVMHATVLGAMVAVFVNSLLMSAIWWLAYKVRTVLPSRLGYLALIVFWLSFEYFHYHWQIEWPWLQLGNGFANTIQLIQWYEFTGVQGGSLWVLIINLLFFQILKKVVACKSAKPHLIAIVTLVLIILVPMVISKLRYARYEENGNEKTIAIVQPNIDPYSESHNAQANNEKVSKFINLANQVLNDSIEFLVGPETVLEQQWIEERIKDYLQFQRLEVLATSRTNLNFVIGASTYKIYEEGEELSSTARTMNDGTRFDAYNTALMINSEGKVQSYHKSILVPGVEKMPFRGLMKIMEKLIINLGGTTGTLGKQDEPTNLVALDGTPVAAIVCYESVFGEYISEFVQKGAELIFVITNDGWWKNTPGYKQHLSFSSLRAIETRRSIARSANTGISCFINQRGDISQATNWWEEATIKGTLKTNKHLTFYVKYGDYISRVAVFMSVLLLLYFVSNWLRNRKE